MKEHIPFEISYPIQVCLLVAIKRHWPHRSDKYWRKTLREYVAALRYMQGR